MSTQPASDTGTPPCDIAPDPELGAAWHLDSFGCPLEESEVIWAAWEPFQRGYMFWRADLDWTYALLFENGADRNQGPVIAGGDKWRWDGSFPYGHGLTPPEGNYEPVRGFGFAWFNFLGGTTGQLGWATEPERGICVTLQSFESGFIFKSNSLVDRCQGDLLNRARDPSFAPLLIGVQEEARWLRR